MVGPILYDGTGLPPSPHRRRFAPRPVPTPAPVVEPEAVIIPPLTRLTVEVTSPEVNLESVALAAGYSVEELSEQMGETHYLREQDPQEPQEQAITESPGEPPADTATGPVSGDKSTTEDAGAATLAALGL